MKILSVIVPSYNEAETLERILKKILSVNLPEDLQKEIFVIDDCSIDDTPVIMQHMAIKYPQIQYIRLSKNRGKGYAVRIGIQHVKGDIIIIQDADLEYNPYDYPALLDPIISKEYKVVYGSRILNKKNKFSYFSFYWGGKFISLITSLLFGQKITDEPTCYKVFDAKLLKSIPLTCDGFGFCPEITAKLLKLGYKIKEVPIQYNPRSKQNGKKIKWKDGIEAIAILIKYKFGNAWMSSLNQNYVVKKSNYLICAKWWLRNSVSLMFAFLFVLYTFSSHPAYHWVYFDLLKSNLQFIHKYPQLTYEQKMQLKLGPSYGYLLFLKRATPPDAVILYPSAQSFQKEGSPFVHEIYNKIYALRFLYPRRLVSTAELRNNLFANRITHVAIVNGDGIEHLPYQVDSTFQHGVLPIKQTK